MPCPICQHTMHNIGAVDDRIYWCPRCGTVKTIVRDRETFEAPKLVAHIRDAEDCTVRTSVDGRTIQYAVHAHFWVPICEAVGFKAIGT